MCGTYRLNYKGLISFQKLAAPAATASRAKYSTKNEATFEIKVPILQLTCYRFVRSIHKGHFDSVLLAPVLVCNVYNSKIWFYVMILIM